MGKRLVGCCGAAFQQGGSRWVTGLGHTYGAVFVSSRMCRFFRSCTSGRCWRCFSKLSRRSKLRVGEMGVSSTLASVMVRASEGEVLAVGSGR